ncbi:MAG: YIP1 family protein [Ignavibacteriae bacterium]|nr:YIP1 family protein [Ignavibacteriota bacterium]
MENNTPNSPPEDETPFQRMLKNPIEWSDEYIVNVDSDVFRTIWTEPTETFKRLVAAQSGGWVQDWIKILFVLGGIARGIDGMEYVYTYNKPFLILGPLVFAIVRGGLFGWIFFYVLSGLLCWTGNKILKGNANEDDYKIIVAWSLVPGIASMAFGVLLLLGEIIQNSESTPEFISDISTALYLFCSGIEIILAIWSVALLVIGIRVIQPFGTGKAILNTFLPGILVLIIFGGVALIFGKLLGE